MKIARLESLHADAGWRNFSFLKITTSDGTVGWSEFTEGDGSHALSSVIDGFAELVIGLDPLRTQSITAFLQAQVTLAAGGINQRAIAAIENALLDIKGKALGVPVHALFGGAVRDRIPLYWSHCLTYRIRYPEILGVPGPRNYDDVARHAEEVRSLGYRGMKTNIALPEGGQLVGVHRYPEMVASPEVRRAAADIVRALREGAGPDASIHLDINFHFKTEGNIQIARAVEPYGLDWLEVDSFDPLALAQVRRATTSPIASCESLYGRRGFRPFLEAYAMDVGIVDVIWNGLGESLRIASMAEIFEVNVAPHNYYGHLCTMISAHFSALVPNFRVMELDVDSVPWRDELFIGTPVIDKGELVIPTAPGWGIEVNEAAVRAHPPR